MNYIQIKNMCSSKNKIKKSKGKSNTGRKYWQHMYMTESLYLEYTVNSTYNSIIRQPSECV